MNETLSLDELRWEWNETFLAMCAAEDRDTRLKLIERLNELEALGA